MKSLDRIAVDCNTDKSSLVHDYCRKYEKWLPFKRWEPITILEIGVLNGESLSMWNGYFFNAKIIGIDINPDCKKYENPNQNIFVEIGSQDDPEFLNYIAEKYGKFDLILDDGSHIQRHMIFSFERLFPHVKSEGVYVVEDTVCSYWESNYEGGFRRPGTSVEHFKDLVDEVNFHGKMIGDYNNAGARREDILIPFIRKTYPQIRTDIESINFLNSIIIITKK